MNKRTPVPAYMLLLGLSNKLKLFCSHSETPCIITIKYKKAINADVKVLPIVAISAIAGSTATIVITVSTDIPGDFNHL